MSAPAISSPFKCKHCDKKTYSQIDTLRVRGWRFFTGATLDGRPIQDVVCPRCAGTAPAEPERQPGWQLRCITCDWYYTDADAVEDDEEPLTAKTAREYGHEHRCDPEVETAPADGSIWYPIGRINLDGTIRPAPEKGPPC